MRSFALEAAEQDSPWLTYLENPILVALTKHRVTRVADAVRDLIGKQFLPLKVDAVNAVCFAIQLKNRAYYDKVLHRIEQADSADDTVREPLCDVIPLLMKPPRHGVGNTVFKAHLEFAERLCAVVQAPAATPEVVLELLAQIIAGKSSGRTYLQLMRHGVPAPEGKDDEDRMPPKHCVELSILVEPNMVAPLVAPFLRELEDPAHFTVMDGRIREAAMPRVKEHVAKLRTRCREEGEWALSRFENVIVEAKRGPVGTQGIPNSVWAAYGYWGYTKESQGEKAPLTLDEFAWRCGGYGDPMAMREVTLMRTENALHITVRCPACDGDAHVEVGMLPTSKHSGLWKLRCDCGHRESKETRRTVLRWSFLECECNVCRPRRAQLMEAMRPYRQNLRERLDEALDGAAQVMLDAFEGRNGFRATEDGEIWRDGILYGRYQEPKSLPGGGISHRFLEDIAYRRVTRGLPISLLLERERNYSRVAYRKPFDKNMLSRGMPTTHLDRFLMGYEDEASFLEWAYTAIAFSVGYFVPLPLSVSVWAEGSPPPWVPRSVQAGISGGLPQAE